MERDYFTSDELVAKKSGIFICDTEAYENYFLAAFKCVDTGKLAYFEATDEFPLATDWLQWMLASYCVVGFNIAKFDLPIIGLALTGAPPSVIKQAVNDIILNDARSADLQLKYNFKTPLANIVDLIEVAPLRGSLKVYASRLHCPHMQDLPYHPDKVLTAEERALTRQYCFNDLDNTELLLKSLNGQLELRAALSTQYGQDLRSKSDAQIAEAIIGAEVAKLTGKRPSRPKIEPLAVYRYKRPTWLRYQTPALQAMLERVCAAEFRVNEAGNISGWDGETIAIGRGLYRMGIGGLHSSEKRAMHVATDQVMLIDRDVASYYPNIILTLGLYPQHIGPAFLEVYRSIVDRRLAAKKAKDYVGAESLKITTNGTFGKLGSPYSILFAPDLMVQVTLTGQLALLMAIEMLELIGIEVISANTDGIVSKCQYMDYKYLSKAFAEWEQETGFITEETQYRIVCSRDVNNYIAIKTDGEVKAKGAYTNPWDDPKKQIFRLFKNPHAMIAVDAAVKHLQDGSPLLDTVRQCRQIERFACVRSVTGGAAKDGRYLGKVIRWYYARGERGVINYCTSGNKVSLSEGGKPMMVLPTRLPDDIDFERYADLAREILEDVGFLTRRDEQMRLDIESEDVYLTQADFGHERINEYE